MIKSIFKSIGRKIKKFFEPDYTSQIKFNSDLEFVKRISKDKAPIYNVDESIKDDEGILDVLGGIFFSLPIINIIAGFFTTIYWVFYLLFGKKPEPSFKHYFLTTEGPKVIIYIIEHQQVLEKLTCVENKNLSQFKEYIKSSNGQRNEYPIYLKTENKKEFYTYAETVVPYQIPTNVKR